jgi:hypothetical protein
VGERILDDTFLILFNPHHEPIRFALPPPTPGVAWELCLDTSRKKGGTARARRFYRLADRSLALFRSTKGQPTIVLV